MSKYNLLNAPNVIYTIYTKINRRKEKVYKYDLKSLVVIACLHLVGRLFHVLAPL